MKAKQKFIKYFPDSLFLNMSWILLKNTAEKSII